VTVAWVALVIAGVILIGVISTYFLVKYVRASARGEYVRGDRVSCYRSPESEAEEGVVQLVMPQRSPFCGSAPEYSVVFREDGHRGRVPAVQMIEKLGHEEADVDEFGDEGSLAFLTSYEARSLVDEIIDESTSAEAPNHHVDIPSEPLPEESGGHLVESVLRTVNDIIDQDKWPQNEAAPQKLQVGSGSEGYAAREDAYDDRDEGYADGEEGYVDIVEETVRQVLNDRRTDEEEMMNVNATQLVESVLRTMDDVDVEEEMMKEPTTSLAAQNLVEDLMDDVWTDEVTTGSSASGNTSDRSKEFVGEILNEIALEDDSSGSGSGGENGEIVGDISAGEASDQSKEFVGAILNDLGVGDAGQPAFGMHSQDFVTDILDSMRMDGDDETQPPTPPQ